VIDVPEFTVKLAETVPKSTADAPVRPVPVINSGYIDGQRAAGNGCRSGRPPVRWR
jgi:hypothetical protein